MSARVAIVDYGLGNRRSVEKALEHVGARVARTADRDAVAAAEAIVLPGVGAFPEAMRRLEALATARKNSSAASCSKPAMSPGGRRSKPSHVQ